MAISRRQLLRDGSLIAGACAFSGGSVNASTPRAVVGADDYQKLGVTLRTFASQVDVAGLRRVVRQLVSDH